MKFSNKKDEKPIITHQDLMIAEDRALRAQQEALDLRKKLEGLEELLAETKNCLESTQSKIELKDLEILKVQSEAKSLANTVTGLEERFQRLKVLQNRLNDKHQELCNKEMEKKSLESKIEDEEKEKDKEQKTEREMNF